MLSYRHGFHAGNLADVLKHSALIAVLEAAITKPAPLVYIDTHAGAGMYSLGVDGEHCAGIALLQENSARALSSNAMPRSVARYLDCVRSFNATSEASHALPLELHTSPSMRRYPGSAMIAAHLLRDSDRLLLCERHPADYETLLEHAARRPASTHRMHRRIRKAEGRAAAARATRRDPDRPRIRTRRRADSGDDALRAALERFGHGVYLVWYPLHGKHDPSVLKRRVKRLAPKTLCIELDPREPASRGATGSGLLIVNPPFQAVAEIELLTTFLGRTLTPYGRAACEWLVPE